MPSTPQKPERRADVNTALRTAARAVARAVPALSRVRASRLLFVYNRSMAPRARVFPLAFDSTGTRVSRAGGRRPLVKFRGRRVLYVIEFGRSFLAATPGRRLTTLVHELMHLSPFFNGTLSRAMRHSRGGDGRFERSVSDSVRRCTVAAEGAVARALEFGPNPVVLVWRRPFSAGTAGVYTEMDLRRSRVRSAVIESGVP